MRRALVWVISKWITDSRKHFDLDDDTIDRATAKDFVGLYRALHSPWFLVLLIMLTPLWVVVLPILVLFEVFSLAAYLLLVVAGVVFFLSVYQVLTGNHSWGMILAMLVSGTITIGVFIVAPLVKRTEWYRVRKRMFCERMREIPIIGGFF